MNGDERVVFVADAPCSGVYWLSEDVQDCEIEAMVAHDTAKQQLGEQLDLSELPAEYHAPVLNGIATIFTKAEPCRLGNALNKALMGCARINHGPDYIHVIINPAKTSWNKIHKAIMPVLLEFLMTESIEKEGW